MLLEVKRFEYGTTYIVSKVYLGGEFQCFGVEERSCIPVGLYSVWITAEKKFPQILDVPGFEGVSIRSDKPSEAGSGSLLLGTSWFGTSSLGQYRLAYLSLLWKLQQDPEAVLLKIGDSLSDFS